MKWIILVIAVLALLASVFGIIEHIKTYNEYKVFNENIRNWSISLDEEMMNAINHAAHMLLIQMDEKINDLNNNDNNLEKDEENSSRED